MLLKAKVLEIEAEKPVVVINSLDAEDMGIMPMDRVEIRYKRKGKVAIVNIAKKFIKRGYLGVYRELAEKMGLEEGVKVNVFPTRNPESIEFIKKKINGNYLERREIRAIIRDIVKHRLSDVEISAFVTALYNKGMTINEAAELSSAMASMGSKLELKKVVYDKHSIGGVPGDKTSILLVPIVASMGLTIPKTSSRAITSPAGTADRFECIAPVELELDEIKRVVEKTNGCLVWGGAVDLAPADDIIIKIEYPLAIDPFLLPSVMAKKKAVNAKYLVIDIPTGREVKVKTKEEYINLSQKFMLLGKKLGINVKTVSTYGEQPIGYAIGPALEAREALRTLINGRGPTDLVDKVCTLAGKLIEFSGMKNGYEKAHEALRSGKAYKKIREIIKMQGGDENIKPGDIEVGSEHVSVKSNIKGRVMMVNIRNVVRVARSAGAPKDKGAGLLLKKKLGDVVKKGDVLFSVYAEKKYKLRRALETIEKFGIFEIGSGVSMMLAQFPEEGMEEKYTIIER